MDNANTITDMAKVKPNFTLILNSNNLVDCRLKTLYMK